MTTWTRKDLLGIEDLSKEEIELVLETARGFREVTGREIKKVPALRGKTVVNLFFENSTRTRTSFEIAAKRLSADVITISKEGSSASKGETLLDTARNLEALGADMIVCRHWASGVPHWLGKNLKASVLNAGDGAHEHPSQALLDLLTIVETKKKVAGLKVAIVGDIGNSRVARSNLHALTKMGATVHAVGPATMVPRGFANLGAKIFYDLREGICDADVIMMLRIQQERIDKSPYPSLREYTELYGLNHDVLKECKKDVIIMHPGPVNRGVEIDPDVADGPYSVILEQVRNGVAVRMALLYLLDGARNL